MSVDKCNEPALEVLVVVVIVALVLVVVPACTSIHSVTFPHASGFCQRFRGVIVMS